MNALRRSFAICLDAFNAFLDDDGWAIASHIALSALMAFFPFLIVITSLAGFLGSRNLADQAADLMLQTWPSQIADTMAAQIHNVLTKTRGDALTLGVLLSAYFASNGVESLRVGLNRAYGVHEPRAWYWLRLESIGYTLVAAILSLVLSLLIVLAPLMLTIARHHLPLLVSGKEHFFNISRYAIAFVSLVGALFVLHAWLPAGRRTFDQILPGTLFTVMASLAAAIGFGQYLAHFANNYVTTYAGLASVVIALVFLYFIAAIFIYGGALNAAIMRSRLPHGQSLQEVQSQEPADSPA